ncbi:MAG: hypothetical protein M3388_04200 [Acidobacteriota bacterium]|nr:hypothetical protein [Acidobacteriota bacterium]
MKSKFMQTIGGTFLALVMLFGVTQIFVSGQESETGASSEEQAERSRQGIVGAWRTAITQRNCQTGLPVGGVGRGLITFHEGGTLSEFNLGPGQNRSPGHGVWEQRHGGHNFSGVFVINRYDATGTFIGTQKVRAAWELSASGNGYTTNAAVEIFDANDNLIGTGCATGVGTRIE